MAQLTLSQINGRFKLLDRPAAPPGKCAVCGAVDRPVLDFGFDLDFYGTVYFCVECFESASEIMGFVPANELEKLHERQAQHQTELNDIIEAVHEYKRASHNLYSDFESTIDNLSAHYAFGVPKKNGRSDIEPERIDEQSADDSVDEGSDLVPDDDSNGPKQQAFIF